jgi:hypothetical protein
VAEPEDEFVEVGLQVPWADAVVDADPPGLRLAKTGWMIGRNSSATWRSPRSMVQFSTGSFVAIRAICGPQRTHPGQAAIIAFTRAMRSTTGKAIDNLTCLLPSRWNSPQANGTANRHC